MPTSPGDRRIQHPLYQQWAPTWAVAHDIYEGAGGFLDPSRPYLVPHPREYLDHSVKDATSGKWGPNPSPSVPSPKLIMRRKLARYENIAATILDGVSGALFQRPVTRTFATENDTLRAWWANVDGRGTDIDAFLSDTWVTGAVFGHAIVLTDKSDMTEPETQADAVLPRIYRYSPLDLIDWLTDDDGNLTAVKLVELAPDRKSVV